MSSYLLETDDATDVHDAVWDEVLHALTRLDGNSCTRVSLHLITVGRLIVGGGDEDRYIVIYTPEDDMLDSLTLVDLGLQGPNIDLTVEGQTGDYPQQWCITYPTLVQTFEYFYSSSNLAPHMRWEVENTGIKADLSMYFP